MQSTGDKTHDCSFSLYRRTVGRGYSDDFPVNFNINGDGFDWRHIIMITLTRYRIPDDVQVVAHIDSNAASAIVIRSIEAVDSVAWRVSR